MDALEKATGATLYAADLAVEGCAHIKVLRSPHHHAKILHIDKAEAEAIPGVFSRAHGRGCQRDQYPEDGWR